MSSRLIARLTFRRPPPVVAAIRLTGVIGQGGFLRGGLNLESLAPSLERAFRLPGLEAIALSINSPGGSITAGLSIYDTMQFIQPDVSTMCVGQAASMGAMLAWFYGLSVVEFAKATTLSFTNTLFGSIAAVFLLGEKLVARRVTALLLGFSGVLIVLRPGSVSYTHLTLPTSDLV